MGKVKKPNRENGQQYRIQSQIATFVFNLLSGWKKEGSLLNWHEEKANKIQIKT